MEMRRVGRNEINEYVWINHELVQHFAAFVEVLINASAGKKTRGVLVIAIKKIDISVYFRIDVIIIEEIIN